MACRPHATVTQTPCQRSRENVILLRAFRCPPYSASRIEIRVSASHNPNDSSAKPSGILTAPDPNQTKMPGGIPYIIGNELAERFSFYGMKCILTVFMTKHLLDSTGQPDYMGDEAAKSAYHLFTAGAYFFPMIGAIIADVLWGKYKTILLISLMYCLGHGCLAMMDVGPMIGAWGMKPFLFVGLALIAMGAGGIKPCVSAHVGDQFGTGNKHLLTQVFNWFYFSINLGAAASTMLTPVLLNVYGAWLAFGLPGILMAVATFMFWIGRHSFVHVPPSGWEEFKRETFSKEGLRALRNLAPLFIIFVPVFWAIFDQTGSAWVLQAESMDRVFGITWLESQVQVVNPVLILILIPTFTYLVYPLMAKFFEPTPLRKIGLGLLLTAAAFAVTGIVESRIEKDGAAPAKALWKDLVAGDVAPESIGSLSATAANVGVAQETIEDYLEKSRQLVANAANEEDEKAVTAGLAADFWKDIVGKKKQPEKLVDVVRSARAVGWGQEKIGPYLSDMPNIAWQILAYLILTSAEILVSIVCLEFAYTQSPPKMKSFIMGVFFLGVSFGNFFVSGLNFVLDRIKSATNSNPLEGATYYWFFTGLMLITFVAYLLFALRYKGETYIQGEEGPAS